MHNAMSFKLHSDINNFYEDYMESGSLINRTIAQSTSGCSDQAKVTVLQSWDRTICACKCISM